MNALAVKPEILFQALSDNTRLRIIRLLVKSDEEICLCEMVDTLLEPQYKLSRHLKILRRVGLLTSRKESRWVYHRLTRNPDYLQQLYLLVRSLPDPDGIYKMDIKHFKRRITLRKESRCQVGILTDDLKNS